MMESETTGMSVTGVLVKFLWFAVIVAVLVVVIVILTRTSFPQSNVQTPAMNNSLIQGSAQNLYLLGPFCYSGTCFTGSLQDACSELNGTVYGESFCATKQAHDVYGPFCTQGTCFNDSAREFCQLVGGVVVGDSFCVKRRL